MYTVQSALEGNQQLLQCLAVCFCDLSILFAYCYCGEIVTQACDISNDLYHTRWYAFGHNEQRSILLAIMRTQKPYQFASFPQLNCSLETFANVRERMFFFSIISFSFCSSPFCAMICIISIYIVHLNVFASSSLLLAASEARIVNFGNLSICFERAHAKDRLSIRQPLCSRCSEVWRHDHLRNVRRSDDVMGCVILSKEMCRMGKSHIGIYL